jgi:hypothetical protein
MGLNRLPQRARIVSGRRTRRPAGEEPGRAGAFSRSSRLSAGDAFCSSFSANGMASGCVQRYALKRGGGASQTTTRARCQSGGCPSRPAEPRTVPEPSIGWRGLGAGGAKTNAPPIDSFCGLERASRERGKVAALREGLEMPIARG